MQNTDRGLWGRIYLAILAAGASVAVVHVTLGLYHLAAIALLMAGAGLFLLGLDHVARLARAFRPELKLLEWIAPPRLPAVLRVASTAGLCAWGYRKQDHWIVDQAGHVSPQLCWAAAKALGPLLQSTHLRGEGQYAVTCHCPLADRRVTFAVEQQRQAA